MWAENAPLRLLALATLVVLCVLGAALMQPAAAPQAHATVYSVEEGAPPSSDAAADQLGQAAVLEGDQSGQDKAPGSPAAGDAADAGAGAATGAEGGGGATAPAPDNAGGATAAPAPDNAGGATTTPAADNQGGGGQAAGQAASAEGASGDSASDEKAETIEDEEVALSSGLGGGEPVASGGTSGIIWLIVAGIVAVVAFFGVSMGRVNSSISKMRHTFRK